MRSDLLNALGRHLALVLAAPCAPLLAQATYVQGFDDVPGGAAALVAQGFQFRDQTTAAGLGWWTADFGVEPYGGTFQPHAGAGSLLYDGVYNAQDAAQVSAWAILPPIPNQIAGDVLSFWLRGWAFVDGQFSGPGAFEVRYSPSGGTDTGSSATSVGSFTTLLSSSVPQDWAPYVQHEVSVPGSGRIAFRIVSSIQVFDSSPAMQLDSLRFNPGPPAFPIPQPGQTVTWTTAMSPIVIAKDVSIPVGGIVRIDPGVEVRLANARTLHVLGAVDANGTAQSPVRFTQLGATGELAPFTNGLLDLEHTVVDAHVHPRTGAFIRALHCTFTSRGSIVNAFDGILDPAHSVLRIEDSTFQSSTIQMTKLMAALRNVDFLQVSSTSDLLLLGYVRLEDVSVDGTALWLGKDKGLQPIYVDGVTVRNSSAHGGLYLQSGTNFLLGPGNVLQNNLWPVEFGTMGAGLLPGSVVPTGGNTQNHVADTDDWDPRGSVVWAGLAVPYVVRTNRFVGEFDILPGARVQFPPGLGWAADSFGRLEARGTEAAPIVFEPFGAAGWGGLQFLNPTAGQRIEHCHLRGASIGAGGGLHVDSCRFESCTTGLVVGEFDWAEVRGTRFVGNGVGIDAAIGSSFGDGAILGASPNDPNSFSGNTVAIEASNSGLPNAAQSSWWGHASGPFHPVSNPTGQGDPFLALNGGTLPVQPWLTAPPDFSDSPPEVAWLDGRDLVVEPGATLLLTFRASDDGQILSQRLSFSPNSDVPGTLQPVVSVASSARSVAFTVPSVGLQTNGQHAFLRIESFDDAGQMGFDDLELVVLDPTLAGAVTFSTNLAGTHVPGDHFEVDYTTNGVSPVVSPSVQGYLLLDGDRAGIALGGGTYSLGRLPGGVTMPEVSTDRARVALILQGTQNRLVWFYSEPFAIRPHALLGDTAPTVAMTSPLSGTPYAAGTLLPVRWSASDDEGLRSFDVQVSTDGGQRWTVAALGLPGTSRAFDWALPPSTGLPDVRVRVVAHDLRFQNSSDGDQRSFRIVPGGPGANYCDANPNSTGLLGTVVGEGSRRVVDNDVVLTAIQLPLNASGYLLNAAAQGSTQNPGGSAGHLCLGSSIGRHLMQVGNTGVTGRLAVTMNLAALPRPSGTAVVQVGQTWNFQFWYRDTLQGSATSNFTDGYSIQFE